MYTAAPSPSKTRVKSDSNILATTKQRIQRQLAAVVQLSEHNASYLEPFEQSWIEHIISEALLVSGDPQISANPLLPPSVRGHPTVNGLREKMSAYGLTPRSWTPPRVAAGDEMNELLATSRSLNSANSLLSCCYDRWSWLQSSGAKRDSSQTNTDELQELLGRRRQRQRYRSSVPSQIPEPMQPPRRNNTTSSASSRAATTSNDSSENSVTLVVDDTVERWRQNAEDALNETTARLEAGGISPRQSPTHSYPPKTYTCRRCLDERQVSLSTAEDDPTAIHTCTTKRALTRRLSNSSLQHSVHHSDFAHTGTTGAACESYLQEKSALHLPFEEHHEFQSAFWSKLHNSFDKEAVNDVSQETESAASNVPRTATSIYASSYLHPYSLSAPQTRPTISQTTQALIGSRPNPAPGFTNPSGLAMYTRPAASSTTSVLSKVLEENQIARSRGRRWLEQQSDQVISRT